MKYTADDVRKLWRIAREHDCTIPDEALDAMRDALLREQANGTLTGTTDNGKHYGVHGSVESINALSDYLHRLEQAKGAQGEAVDPPLPGRWHHGNGHLVCGSFRIARADWESGVCAAEGMREQVFDWICERLNTAPRAAVPDGWKLVPIAPTEKMVEAGRSAVMARDCSGPNWGPADHYRAAGISRDGIPDSLFKSKGKMDKAWGAELVYAAMLSAAPSDGGEQGERHE